VPPNQSTFCPGSPSQRQRSCPCLSPPPPNSPSGNLLAGGIPSSVVGMPQLRCVNCTWSLSPSPCGCLWVHGGGLGVLGCAPPPPCAWPDSPCEVAWEMEDPVLRYVLASSPFCSRGIALAHHCYLWVLQKGEKGHSVSACPIHVHRWTGGGVTEPCPLGPLPCVPCAHSDPPPPTPHPPPPTPHPHPVTWLAGPLTFQITPSQARSRAAS
jgi:hypothetical protein